MTPGRVPVLQDIVAHTFGLGAWPVRLEPPLVATTKHGQAQEPTLTVSP